MYMMQDAYSKYITSLYFSLAVVVCAFFLINLTIAIMLKNYDELDKNEKNTTHQASLIEIGMLTKLPSKLIYFIVQEENLIVSKKAKKRLKDTGEKQSFKNQFILSFVYAKIEMPKGGYYDWRVPRFFYWLVQLPIFSSFILLCIMLNTMFLSLERHPMPEGEAAVYANVNYFFTSVFAIEVVLKMIGLSPKKFIIDKFNIFDSVIVLVSVLEIFVSSGGGGISALRAFRLFRIFKLFRTGNLRVLLDSIAYTMGTIGNYVVLLGLFIYVYSLLGMQFFAGKLTFDKDGVYDPNGEVARANFDSIYWAPITVFEVLIGDNWNQVMYDCRKAVGVFSTVYFISLILFGSIIMLNLFLAILLGNFDKARTFWLKKSIFEMFETAIDKNYSLSKAISIILGDVNKTVRDELLAHDPQDIFRLHGRLMIIDRKLMENDPENQDKLIYYDKYAAFEDEYEPVIEFAQDEYEDMEEASEGEGDDEDENPFDLKNEEVKVQQNNFMESISKSVNAEPQLSVIEEKKQLDESGDELMVTKKPSYTALIDKDPPLLKPVLISNLGENTFTFDKKAKMEMLDPKERMNNTAGANHALNSNFVTLGTPREKVEDLEELAPDTTKLLNGEHKILTKSVTFDVRHSEDHGIMSGNMEEEQSLQDNVTKKSEEIDDEGNLVPVKNHKWYYLIWLHISCSSLCIFHRDWRMRKFVIELVVSPETRAEYIQKKKDDAPFDSLPTEMTRSKKVKRRPKVVKSMMTNDLNLLEEEKVMDPVKKTKSYLGKSEQDILDSSMKLPQSKSASKSQMEIKAELKTEELKEAKKKARHPSKYFDYVVILLIVLSSILLVLDNPLNDPGSTYSLVLQNIDYVFTFLFTTEAIIKIIGLGFMWSSIESQPYIRNGWNMLDFLVVAASLLDIIVMIQNTDSVDTGQLKSLKALRALRALRPLRMISRNEGMRLVVNALFASIPSMTNVLIVCLLFILIFASAGISFFAGKFYYCWTGNDDDISVDLIDLDLIDNNID